MALMQLLRTSFEEWQKDNAARLAASLAYYMMFSLAPLLIIVIGVAGLVLGRETAQGQLMAQLAEIVGLETAQAINSLVQNSNIQTASLTATLLGVFTLLIGATGVFGELQASLNQVWDVKPKAVTNFGEGVRGLVMSRLLSLSMVLGIGLLLIITIVVSTLLSGVARRLLGEELALVGQAINFLLAFIVTVIMFAALYRVLPDLKIAWQDVWVGAIFTALLFSVGRLLIGVYLGLSSSASVFGAAASLIVLLIWIYYSAQKFFFGAEFTQVYARTRGTRRREEYLLDAPMAEEVLPVVAPEIGNVSPSASQTSFRSSTPIKPIHTYQVARPCATNRTRASDAPSSRLGWIAAFAIFGSLIAAGALNARPASRSKTPSAS